MGRVQLEIWYWQMSKFCILFSWGTYGPFGEPPPHLGCPAAHLFMTLPQVRYSMGT